MLQEPPAPQPAREHRQETKKGQKKTPNTQFLKSPGSHCCWGVAYSILSQPRPRPRSCPWWPSWQPGVFAPWAPPASVPSRTPRQRRSCLLRHPFSHRSISYHQNSKRFYPANVILSYVPLTQKLSFFLFLSPTATKRLSLALPVRLYARQVPILPPQSLHVFRHHSYTQC